VSERHDVGVLDTSTFIVLDRLDDPDLLPRER